MERQDFVCNGESIYCHSHFTIMLYTRHNLIKINIFRTSQSTDIWSRFESDTNYSLHLENNLINFTRSSKMVHNTDFCSAYQSYCGVNIDKLVRT